MLLLREGAVRVYVLEHRGIEDDIRIRGIYARREDAEADVPNTELYDFGYKTPQPRHWGHADYCCSVSEYEVKEAADPFVEYVPPPRTEGNALISPQVEDELLKIWTRKFPFYGVYATPEATLDGTPI